MPSADSGMTYRTLGRCGTQVSVFGLGGWLTFGNHVADAQVIDTMIRMAYDRGVNFFDIADVYARGEAERLMGRVLATLPRHHLIISSKVFFPMSDDVNDRGLSRKHITESIEGSLRRIGTDYLDLYFCHRFDEHCPVEETARAMDDLVHQGKILYWGTSEWSGRQLRQAHDLCATRQLVAPQVEQPQYSLLYRGKFENNVRPATEELGMGVVCWSPLAMGLLTGKYDNGIPAGSRLEREAWLREGRLIEDRLRRVRQFKQVADRVECSRAQMALAWAAAQPGISSVILGATTPQQLEHNLEAGQVTVTPEVQAALHNLFPVASPD